jgi:hypothetical protein
MESKRNPTSPEHCALAATRSHVFQLFKNEVRLARRVRLGVHAYNFFKERFGLRVGRSKRPLQNVQVHRLRSQVHPPAKPSKYGKRPVWEVGAHVRVAHHQIGFREQAASCVSTVANGAEPQTTGSLSKGKFTVCVVGG